MMRTPEPELMDAPDQAEAYARADFGAVNQAFVARFRAHFPEFTTGRVCDLGCGPADIPIRLCKALPEVRVVAVDGAQAMLDQAARALEDARLGKRIELVQGFLPGAVDGPFDALISNSLLHHLPDPEVLFTEIARLAAPGAPVLVVDLMRPESREAAQAIVDTHAAGEREILRLDFFNSLLAAFTIDEIEALLNALGIAGYLQVEATSDRHMAIWGKMPG